ncbi:gamma-aminobutyric acid receptor alpha-like [Stegodyphus dumicola]|uniref:gamma-aminobutyric acid receptor alpha-like n=1 Tax=Stegodyphus dumicola TaxID=202533 RepID=UPI0015A9DFCB|nr:gamma-aminobutyric acid receptor alpha-like [Stegodyphus dumicola]
MTNTSKLLDSLLSSENYDRQIRPGFGGEPTTVLTDIEIRSFGSISETDMIFSMDCYFRQTWFDQRLRFQSGNLTVLSMDWKFLQRIWTPDTYFLNGKISYLHKVSAPNKFIRIRCDGQLKYSMRLTIQTNCPMHLRKYPLDKQACPLFIGSFAYTSKDVLYKWNGPHPVAVADDVTLSQYDYLDIQLANHTKGESEGSSSLTAQFILRRRRGYFILQIYAPCAMIVGASWVSFWINKSDAPGRVAVGATTVLTLVTMGFGGRSSLPRVAYATAIDWFVILCFSFVFAAMVEYACVNVVDRNDLLKRQRKKEFLMQHGISEADELPKENGEDTELTIECQNHHKPPIKNTRKCRLFPAKRKKTYREIRSKMMNKCYPDRGSRIDAYARVLFPCAFALFNVLYWTLYLYTIDDEIPDNLSI